MAFSSLPKTTAASKASQRLAPAIPYPSPPSRLEEERQQRMKLDALQCPQ